MSIKALYYRFLGPKGQLYVEYSLRILALLLGSSCIVLAAIWLLPSGSTVSDAKTAGSESLEAVNLARSSLRHAWEQYRKHSWGANELAPNSKAPCKVTDKLVGRKSGLTIVESLSTLHLMGLDVEFLQAKQWIESDFDFTNVTDSVSTSETSSRLLGGLLSAFSLTEQPVFLYKALQVAEGLLVAFETSSGLPASTTTPFQGPHHGGDRLVRLDQIVPLYLELSFLNRLTGLAKYGEAAAAILAPLTKHLTSQPTANDTSSAVWWPPSLWDVRTGAPATDQLPKVDDWTNLLGLLKLAEVTIKAHLLLDGDRSVLNLFQRLISGRLRLEAWLNCRPSESNECRFNLTVCRLVETLLLSMGQSRDPIVQRDFAHQLGNLCLSTVQLGELNLTPDQLLLRQSTRPLANNGLELVEAANAHYAAPPEPVLAGLLLWSRRRRIQHAQLLTLTLRSIAQRLRGPSGYQGLRRVALSSSSGARKENSGAAGGGAGGDELQTDNRQPSYLLGQTLKYIYMAFEPTQLNLVSGDWVFNTAGQLLPVCSGRQFSRLRQLVDTNWLEVRRQLADLEVLRLTRQRQRSKDIEVELEARRGGCVRHGDPTVWVPAIIAAFLSVLF